MLHHQEVVALHRRQIHSITTQGVICGSLTNSYQHLTNSFRAPIPYSKVFPFYLSIGVWNQGSSNNIRLPTMVCRIRPEHKKSVQCILYKGIYPRTLRTHKVHAGASIFVQRNTNAKPVLQNCFLSASQAQVFLRQMSKTTESNCNCLPDCELMDLQYSVTTTNFM